MPLSCPNPQNYAAVAKQLHETALQVEARIYELEYQLRAAANRPTIVQTTTAAQTGITSAGGEQIIGPGQGVAFTETFNNTAVASDEPISNNDTILNVLADGLYEVGLTGNVIPSGAADANSFRIVRVQHYTPDPGSAGPILTGFSMVNHASYTTFESNVGNGEDFTLVGEFKMKAGDLIYFTLQHNNTSSSMNLSTGAIAWIHKLSDPTLTAVL